MIPRLSGVLGTPAISDVLSVSHSDSDNSTTFTRPIYAGNAIATVKAPGSLPLKIFTVRPTAFAKASEDNSSTVEAKAIEPIPVYDSPTKHLKTEITKSDRPELGTAARIVSGGRALKNAETFKKTIDPLADVLGAAVGASRAAVDAGYVDNSLQVSTRYGPFDLPLNLWRCYSGWPNRQGCRPRALYCRWNQRCHSASRWYEGFQAYCCDQ